MISEVVLIGAGNVGFHLSQQLHHLGISILQILSRQHAKAESLAAKVNAQAETDFKKINSKAQLYILAVPDDAIAEVSKKLKVYIAEDAFVVHCSGSTPATVLAPFFKRYGVFYPLQTFSISRRPDFSRIPFCIYANEEEDQDALNELALKISPHVYYLDDAQRGALHVGAVFVNNFTNHLFTLAHQLMDDQKLPFELLKPLIMATAEKVQHAEPNQMQTGPAIRGDKATINRHLEYLNQYPEYQTIYDVLTKSIEDYYQQKNDS